MHPLILIHAILGGIALISGTVPLVVKKGSRMHVLFGNIFFYTLLTSSILALVIACMPDHESYFLFAVGLFSLYLIVQGKRAIQFKVKTNANWIDYLISCTMMAVGLGMIILPYFIWGEFKIVLAVFGAVGCFFAAQELRFYQHPHKRKNGWLVMHIGRITGGYIASVTAFVVVNQALPGIVGWIAPGVIGGIYITFWSRKVSRK